MICGFLTGINRNAPTFISPFSLGTLNLYLKNKSEHYDDPAKKAIFLLNNYNYIVISLQSSGIVSLVSSLDNRMEMTYQQLVSIKR